MDLRPIGHSDASPSYMALKKSFKMMLIFFQKEHFILAFPGRPRQVSSPSNVAQGPLKLPFRLLSLLPQGHTGTHSVTAPSAGKTVILSTLTFAAFMNWILKVKIVKKKEKKRNQVVILSPLTTSLIKILRKKIDCGKL